jgi:hypothetical protein
MDDTVEEQEFEDEAWEAATVIQMTQAQNSTAMW